MSGWTIFSIIMLALIGIGVLAVGYLFVVSLPDLKRYLRIRSM
ncbi:DUF6893 family small protein [Spectribacter hydrogenooxidans]|uniref:Uncharacterized protein n=1 Tax=Spectribacter hydrogenoxidans TaxID=3075608 RepID=A0ABU3C412_9GAMM|nr:hypothetical protein [Salinisphaera sp. W335]MDT0636282.1 hypothetical protein [Salinisphaera sp. W335]